MNVLRAKVLGFCMGVRRAVEMAGEAISAVPALSAPAPARALALAESAPERPPIYTLGPLIHNPQVLASLAERGVQILEETELFAGPAKPVTDTSAKLAGAVVIIRAHGVSPRAEQILRERGCRIIDATCPRVKANQNAALALAERGYRIFLAGEREHAEIKGIYGYCLAGAARTGAQTETACVIVGNPEEADRSAGQWKDLSVKTALIGQTTISEDEYRSIAEAIKKHFPNLDVKNTICGATRDRQDALRELCSAVDAVIIAGGKESANTRRLFSIARGCGKPAWLAETAADLPPECRAFTTLGLSAGASTPDSVIDEIERALL